MSKSQDFNKLLDENLLESEYQDFLEMNTEFIPRHFLNNHDIHASIVLPKLKFGGDYATDFFYLTKSSVEWHAVFIEIEKPSCRFFTKNGKFTSDFNNAIDQIGSWKAWLSSPEHQSYFRDYIDALLFPSSMAKNPISYKFILVYGRREEYIGDQTRIRKIKAKKSDDFEIMSFDRLVSDYDPKLALNIGIRHNEYISIKEDIIIDPQMFAFCTPSKFEVSQKVYSFLKKGRDLSHLPDFVKNVEREDYYIKAADRVRVRK